MKRDLSLARVSPDKGNVSSWGRPCAIYLAQAVVLTIADPIADIPSKALRTMIATAKDYSSSKMKSWRKASDVVAVVLSLPICARTAGRPL